MTPWRLLDTGDLSASFNMAIDEALLRLHVPGESRPTLRFYRWSPAAVSLGYFQKRHAIDLYACRKLGLEVVRRTTGGGRYCTKTISPTVWLPIRGRASPRPSMPHIACSAKGCWRGFAGWVLKRRSGERRRHHLRQTSVLYMRPSRISSTKEGSSWEAPRLGKVHPCCSTAPSFWSRRRRHGL